MSIFVVSALSKIANEPGGCSCPEPDSLARAIETNIAENDRIKLNPCSWILAFDGTIAELNEKIGLRGGKNGLAILVGVDRTSGYGPRALKDWIRNHSEK
jgi:hypothetical protein